MSESTVESVLTKLGKAFPNGVPLRHAFEPGEWTANNANCRAVKAYLLLEGLATFPDKQHLYCTNKGLTVMLDGGIEKYEEDSRKRDEDEEEMKRLAKESLTSNIEFGKKSLDIAKEANEIAGKANLLAEFSQKRAERANAISIAAAIIAALATLISIFKN